MEKMQTDTQKGYSKNIENADFDKTRQTRLLRDEVLYVIILSVAVIVTLLVGIFRYQDPKNTLIFAAIVIAVGALFYYILKVKKQPDETYDGVIKHIDKNEETYKKSGRYLVSYVAITRDDGKILVYNNIISSIHNDYTTYYKIGDRVRHHKGYLLPEKYDKSGDDKIVCLACGHLVDKKEKYCSKCQKILLK